MPFLTFDRLYAMAKVQLLYIASENLPNPCVYGPNAVGGAHLNMLVSVEADQDGLSLSELLV